MGGCVSSHGVLVPAAGQPDEFLLHVEPTKMLALYKEFNDHDDQKKWVYWAHEFLPGKSQTLGT